MGCTFRCYNNNHLLYEITRLRVITQCIANSQAQEKKGAKMTMVLKNRSRVEILYDIISAAKPSSKKTHLMYKGNLSYQQLDLYLNFILQNGLLEERFIDDTRLYCITQKGMQFLTLFDDMHNLITPPKPQTAQETAKPENQVIQTESFIY
jgi:predicted transcriptional regulator